MLEKLKEIIKILPDLLREKLENNEVQTMYIDYHKPYVSRLWFKHEDIRVYLHKIEPCEDSAEALFHPHPWNSAMVILKGSYEMDVGHSKTNKTPLIYCKLILNKGAMYEMTEPNGWHYVNPIKEPVYTLMITGDLNGREMPIKPNKEFRELNFYEVVDIMSSVCNF